MSSLICTVYHVVYAPAGVVDLLACIQVPPLFVELIFGSLFGLGFKAP